MNTFRLLTALLSTALFASESLATGGSGDVVLRTGADTTSSECTVREGRDCHFAFNSTTEAEGINSKVFQVNARTAVACLAPMVVGNEVGVVTFWKVVGTSNTGTRYNSVVPTAASASTLSLAVNTDCFTMSTGRWWIEVVSKASTSDYAIVVITGSEE
jgi:hypothetical protein